VRVRVPTLVATRLLRSSLFAFCVAFWWCCAAGVAAFAFHLSGSLPHPGGHRVRPSFSGLDLGMPCTCVHVCACVRGCVRACVTQGEACTYQQSNAACIVALASAFSMPIGQLLRIGSLPYHHPSSPPPPPRPLPHHDHPGVGQHVRPTTCD